MASPVSSDSSSTQKTPPVARSNTNLTVDTEYIHMLLDLEKIHWSYNLVASVSAWTLLAGYLVIPGTFTTLQKVDSLEDTFHDRNLDDQILHTVQNPPLAAIGCTFLGLGLIAMVLLFRRWGHNYIWVTNRLFLPTCLNAGAGLVTSLINIYTAKDGDWSIMAILTVITTSMSAIVSLSLTIFYKFWKLRLVYNEHERQMKAGL